VIVTAVDPMKGSKTAQRIVVDSDPTDNRAVEFEL